MSKTTTEPRRGSAKQKSKPFIAIRGRRVRLDQVEIFYRDTTATTLASASEPLAWNTSSKTRPPTFACAPPTRHEP